jgi:hypothetical protein
MARRIRRESACVGADALVPAPPTRRERHLHLHVVAALRGADQLLAKVGVQVAGQGLVPELDMETVLDDAVVRVRPTTPA